MRKFYFLVFIIHFSFLGIVKAQDSTRCSFSSFTHEQVSANTVILDWDINGQEPLCYVLETYNYPFVMDEWFPYTEVNGDMYSCRLSNIRIGTHIYRLRAVYANNSILSDTISFTIASYNTLRNFHFYDTTDRTKVKICWEPSGIMPASYQLEFNGAILVLPDSVFCYEFSNLKTDTTYTYNLIAIYSNSQTLQIANEPVYMPDSMTARLSKGLIDTASRIGLANYYSTRTVALPSRGGATFVHYFPPTDFRYHLDGNTVILMWNYPEGEEPAYFSIYRNDECIGIISRNAWEYVDENVESGIYTYRLWAVFEDGICTEADNILTVSINRYPMPPINFSYTIENENNVILTWEIHPDGMMPFYYKIHRNDDFEAILSGNRLTYTDSDLSAGSYSYRLLLSTMMERSLKQKM